MNDYEYLAKQSGLGTAIGELGGMVRRRLFVLAICAVVGWSPYAHAAAGGAGAGGPVPGAAPTPVTPWVLMACPALIVLAAFVNHHRQLTAAEAWSCGLLALFPWRAPVSEPPLRVKG